MSRRIEEATATAMHRLSDELGVEALLVPPVAPGADAAGIAGEIAVVLGRSLGITRRELPWA